MRIGGEGVEVAANKAQGSFNSLQIISMRLIGLVVSLQWHSQIRQRGNRQVLRVTDKYYLQGGDFIRNPQDLNLPVSPLPVYLSHCNGATDLIRYMAEHHSSLFQLGGCLQLKLIYKGISEHSERAVTFRKIHFLRIPALRL